MTFSFACCFVVQCVSIAEDGKTIILASKPTNRSFTFDHAAGEDSTQEEIFLEVGKPITEVNTIATLLAVFVHHVMSDSLCLVSSVSQGLSARLQWDLLDLWPDRLWQDVHNLWAQRSCSALWG